ncbi:MAG: high-potential iron-sulfur protein [Bdellovibrionota bacterium]
MSNNENASRRLFFKQIALATAAGSFFTFLGQSFGQVKAEMIDMTLKKRKDATNATCVTAAKNLKYNDDAKALAKDFNTGKLPKPGSFKDKAGKEIAYEARTCEKCALFGLPDPKVHNCALIPGCLVSAKGSCVSWSPKA